MPVRLFLAAVALTFALALPARAAATPEPLPGQLEAHIVLKSAYGLVAAIDTYAAAATEGTGNAIPPGFIGMMAQISLPVPFDSWDSDGELHILVPRAEESDDADDVDFVVVFGTQDFSAFVQSLENRGWAADDEHVDIGGYDDARSVVVPGGDAMVVADLGEGRAALGRDVTVIAAALKDWTPASVSDADIFAHFALGGDGARLKDEILDALNEKKDDIAGSIADAGFKADFARNLMAAVEKIIPRVTDELSAMKSAVVEVTFAGEDCVIELGGRSSSGALADDIARTLTAGDAVDTAALGLIPPGAASVAVAAGLPDVIPDAKERMVALASFLYGGIAPEYKDEIVARTREFMDSGPGDTATGSYIDGAAMYSLSVSTAKDPAKMLAAANGSIEWFNTVWAAAIDDPDLGFTLSGSKQGEGEGAYYRYEPVFADEEKFQTLLDRLADSGDELDLNVPQIKEFRLFLAAGENGMISASGDVTDETFLAFLNGTLRPAGDPPFSGEKAAELLDALPARQALAVILDAGGFSRMYAMQLARDAGLTAPEEMARLAEILDAPAGEETTDRQFFGFSVGAEKGWLNSRTLLPAGAVARIIGDVEKLHSVGTSTPDSAPAPMEDPDEHEDDPEEEEPAEEDASAA